MALVELRCCILETQAAHSPSRNVWDQEQRRAVEIRDQAGQVAQLDAHVFCKSLPGVPEELSLLCWPIGQRRSLAKKMFVAADNRKFHRARLYGKQGIVCVVCARSV